jgi:uncharacterized protein with NAD-binding domain and iron-sulfur cluster
MKNSHGRLRSSSGAFASGLQAAAVAVLLEILLLLLLSGCTFTTVDAGFQEAATSSHQLHALIFSATSISKRTSQVHQGSRRNGIGDVVGRDSSGSSPMTMRMDALWAMKDELSSSELSIADGDDDDGNDDDAASSTQLQPTAVQKKQKIRFVVVGAGWAGWGAAKALCESSLSFTTTVGEEQNDSNDILEVILLDTLPDPTGRTPYTSTTGKPVEAGTRGFWKDYPNINALCSQLQSEDDVFTDYTNSSLYSPDGLEATSPVFAQAKSPDRLLGGFLPLPSFLAGASLQNVPSPLGQVLASASLFERLPIADRASVIGFLLATIDCIGSLNDETIQKQYDRMTAHDLFLRFGMSPRLVRDIVKPLVLVCLFKPPEELSALVTMELFYFFTLAHMDSFDVRWIKNGTVADSMTAPLANRLLDNYNNLKVLGGCRVGTIALVNDDVNDKSSSRPKRKKVSTVEYTRQDGSKETIHDVHGVVLAVTSRGMRAVVSASPDLAQFPVFSQAASCGDGIDVMSVRLWLNRIVPTRTPSNIFSCRFEALRGAGGTFFMLDQLQNSSVALNRLWGKHDDDDDDDDDDLPLGSVVACDFYNAGALLPLTDQDIVEMLIKDLLPAAVAEFSNAQVVDSWVCRYPGAVSWFAPGSFEKRPPLEGAGSLELPNLKCAGDWVRMGGELEQQSAKGLCQERAYVSGLHAAIALLRDTVGRDTTLKYQPHRVIPIRDDEVQFKASVALNKQVMKFLPRFWVR